MDSCKIKAISYERERHLDNTKKYIHQASAFAGFYAQFFRAGMKPIL